MLPRNADQSLLGGSLPFYSVVIPAYNAETFILDTLESVRSQDMRDYEIVFVDDGSVDKTAERVTVWAESHQDVRLKLVRQKNKGIGGARNAGILRAEGEFVAFLDADDRWSERKLSTVQSFLNQHREVDFLCHDENLVEYGKVTKVNTYGPYKTYEDLLFNGDCISTSASVVRRTRLLDVGLFSENLDYNGVEDYELWLRLSKICRIEYLHVILGEYTVHGGGISSNVENQVRNAINVLNHHLSTFQGTLSPARIRRRRALTYHGAGRTFQKRRQVRQSLRWYLMAIREYPALWKSYAGIVLTVTGIRA